MSKRGIIGFLTALGLTAQFANGQLQPDCNPLHTDCPSKKSWPQENYYIDFTKQKGPPSDWTVANSEVVNFTSNGAELSYAKRGDAPNMWTDFYMLGGRYDVEMKIAPGQGVISSAALWSDTQDEIDFEFSGNQFGQTPFPPRDGMWAFETNIFTQGKMWDGAATYQKDSYKPAEQFHKYSVEWDEDHMNWYVDDKVVRSVLAKDTPKGFAFPQSPMKLQLGVWGGGDPSNNHWTIQWAGGEVDMKGAPYTMYVKSVNITNKYPACQYRYKDKVASSSVDAASSSASLSSQASGSSYLASSPSASSASVSSTSGSLSSVTQPATSSIVSGTVVSYSESFGSASSSVIGGSNNTISTIYSSTAKSPPRPSPRTLPFAQSRKLSSMA
ncbi:glycoside hydrolase family 16 protein [Daldinia loculata]|uniref:glycoside hydrolase family 16 protein n=1 Tax=Daldinia loculata TaxID=103429 RepID=UPI0020C511F0|nr:glycoside hydrolase family 16 protein [Daldinia loculata]KAI1642223.1 glycoside hydrolase family 16 protein [Daldinia loculata]